VYTSLRKLLGYRHVHWCRCSDDRSLWPPCESSIYVVQHGSLTQRTRAATGSPHHCQLGVRQNATRDPQVALADAPQTYDENTIESRHHLTPHYTSFFATSYGVAALRN